MGSPLAPILANTFMGYHEQTWLNEYKGNSPSHFRRYVDDIFAVFSNNDEAENFLSYLNIQHNNIKFTIEVEVDGKLPFLDVLVSKYTGVLNTSVYHKKTYTGLLTNYFSFCSLSFKINNTWLSFDSDVNNLTTTLRKNMFPLHVINKQIATYLNSKYKDKDDQISEQLDTRYFKLPYIGPYSNFTHRKIRKLITKCCKPIDIKVVFTSFKLNSMTSVKDMIKV